MAVSELVTQRIHVRTYGAYPTEERSDYDCYDALTVALNDASDKGLELEFDQGNYLVSKGLVSLGKSHRIQGAGASRTFIKCLSTTDTVLALGPADEAGSGLIPSGYIHDISLIGSSIDSYDSAGLLIDGLRNFKVRNVYASGTVFGYDLKHNAYGTSFDNARTIFGECQVGILLRGATAGGWGCGSDLSFINCWFGGRKASVWINPDGGGYHFTNGQLGSGYKLTADDDNSGPVIFGIDYFDNTKTGAVGNINFDGIDFEGWHHGWAFRGYGRAVMNVRDCSFLATSTTAKAMGIMKVTGAENGQYVFESNTVDGQYSQPKLINISGNGSALSITEIGTLFGYRCYVAGTQHTTGQSMLGQSSFGAGIVLGRVGSSPYLGLGPMRLRYNSTNRMLEINHNHGTGAFVPVTGEITTTSARPTTNLYAGKPGFDLTLNKPIWRNSTNTGWIDANSNPV